MLATLVLLSAFGLASCSSPPHSPRVLPNKTTEFKELTKDDVLLLMDQDVINSSFVSVKGVRLGDSDESVIAKLGRPAAFESFEVDTVNLRFEDPNTNDTELIVHIDGGKVARIAVKPGLDDELINYSRMNYTKESVTRAFGKPTRIQDTKYYHIMEFDDLGLEVYLKARRIAGYAFVSPK